MHDSVCISGCICHHFNLISNFRSQQNFYTILFAYKYYVVEVHFLTHFHNAFKWRYRMFYGMFYLTGSLLDSVGTNWERFQHMS